MKKDIKILKILFGTQNVLSIIPGLAMTAAIAVAAHYGVVLLEKIIPSGNSPVSAIMFAILLGMIINNVVKIPKIFCPGISFSSKKLLKFGIILLGIRLSLFDFLKIAGVSVIIIIVCISGVIILINFISKKVKLPAKMGTLIAVGTSICGVSAIAATGPGIEASEEEMTYAISTITLFGMLAMFVYPYLVHFVFSFDNMQAGMFLGTAIHDTGSATGAAIAYDQLWTNGLLNGIPTVTDIAVVTKLVRNAFMIVVLPLMIFLHRRNIVHEETKKINFFEIFPVFVLWFILMVIIRSVGDKLFIVENVKTFSWDNIVQFIKSWSGNLLVVALAGIGLNTSYKKIKELGFKPLMIGFIAAVFVGALSFGMILLLSPHFSF
jgi:uncharacterized integral membrane protein (TIGR00698 family)